MKLYEQIQLKRDRHFAKLKLREAELRAIEGLDQMGIAEGRIKKYLERIHGEDGWEWWIDDIHQRVKEWDGLRDIFVEVQGHLFDVIRGREEIEALK